MRVICIDKFGPDCIDSPVVVKEGDVFTVVDMHEGMGSLWYVFAEVGPEFLYNSKAFIRISDIDETELLEQRELESPLIGAQ